MCCELIEEIACDGSFCLVRNASPYGHLVPLTMLMFGPTCGTCASTGEIENRTPPMMDTARLSITNEVFMRLLPFSWVKSNPVDVCVVSVTL